MLVKHLRVFEAFESVWVKHLRTACLFFLVDGDGRFGFDVPEAPIPNPVDVPEGFEDPRFGKREEFGSPQVPLWEQEAELLNVAKDGTKKNRNFWREAERIGVIRYKPSKAALAHVMKIIAGREVHIVASELVYENFRSAGFFLNSGLNITQVAVVPDARWKYHNFESKPFVRNERLNTTQPARNAMYDEFAIAHHLENDTIWKDAQVIDFDRYVRKDEPLDVLEANKLWDFASSKIARDETYWNGLCYVCGGPTKTNQFGDTYCPDVAWKFVDGKFEYQDFHCRQYDSVYEQFDSEFEVAEKPAELSAFWKLVTFRACLELHRTPKLFCPVCFEDEDKGEIHAACMKSPAERVAEAKRERDLMREIRNWVPVAGVTQAQARPKGVTLRQHSVN